MRIIQSNTLPENWIELVQKFDINKSNLSENNKIIATYFTLSFHETLDYKKPMNVYYESWKINKEIFNTQEKSVA